jgi:hypothetical protein
LKDEDSKERQSHTEKAHIEAYDIVKSFIERFVILGKSVVKLNELRKIYVSKLAETEFSNPNYRSENLKVNLSCSMELTKWATFGVVTWVFF